jgi:hypothetical protein
MALVKNDETDPSPQLPPQHAQGRHAPQPFELSTELIRKAGKPKEFGNVVKLQEAESIVWPARANSRNGTAVPGAHPAGWDRAKFAEINITANIARP